VAAVPQPGPAAQTTNRPPPVVDLNAKPAQSAPAAATPARTINNTSLIAGGAVLALLVIGILAFAMARSRRRRREEQEWADQQTMAYEPFETAAAPEPMIHEEQPKIVGPEASAFAWGNEHTAPETAPADEPTADDDRRPGETWVERAYRGPSPANPSVSLKARLKRAAFFDKREREAAAGLAAPVDPAAGLPDAMVEEQAEERELA
jgi:hypothetical protein